jgi:hypothetical protein
MGSPAEASRDHGHVSLAPQADATRSSLDVSLVAMRTSSAALISLEDVSVVCGNCRNGSAFNRSGTDYDGHVIRHVFQVSLRKSHASANYNGRKL